MLLSEERAHLLEECLEEEQAFAEPVDEFSHSRNVPLICFVVRGGQVSYLALGKRGMRAGTNKRRLNIANIERLGTSIAIESVLARIPQRIKTRVENRFSHGGLLATRGFEAVLDALGDHDQELSQILARFGRDRSNRVAQLSQATRNALALQKEAIVTALSVAGLDREPLQRWSPQETGEAQSFLAGLESARLREDPMVINDLRNLPGFDLVRTFPYCASIFSNDSTRLTVVLANRLPLEEQTGADLIYFNETFRCFVMVQYKAMERNDGEAVFRLPNEQLDTEISRMDSILAALRGCAHDPSRDGFRLNQNPFFLKLCSRIVFNPDDVGLVPGMYLPLDYWRTLAQRTYLRGPRGGLGVTRENVGRYFDNSEFISLVAKSWVGTTVTQSGVLEVVIRDTIESGKSVVIAIKSDIAPLSSEESEQVARSHAPEGI